MFNLFKIDEASKAIIDSLKNYPTSWKFTGYRIVHDSGMAIWIANEDYGIEIDGNFVPDYVSRKALYKAYLNWRKNNIIVKVSKP